MAVLKQQPWACTSNSKHYASQWLHCRNDKSSFKGMRHFSKMGHCSHSVALSHSILGSPWGHHDTDQIHLPLWMSHKVHNSGPSHHLCTGKIWECLRSPQQKWLLLHSASLSLILHLLLASSRLRLHLSLVLHWYSCQAMCLQGRNLSPASSMIS